MICRTLLSCPVVTVTSANDRAGQAGQGRAGRAGQGRAGQSSYLQGSQFASQLNNLELAKDVFLGVCSLPTRPVMVGAGLLVQRRVYRIPAPNAVCTAGIGRSREAGQCQEGGKELGEKIGREVEIRGLSVNMDACSAQVGSLGWDVGWALKFADDTARLVTYLLLSRLGCDRNAVLTVTLTCNWVAMQHSEQHPRISPSISRPLSMQLRDLPPGEEGGEVGRWGHNGKGTKE